MFDSRSAPRLLGMEFFDRPAFLRAAQPLMVDPNSPIADFYPLEFATDLNGKKADWEALVLIPFFDEVRARPGPARRQLLVPFTPFPWRVGVWAGPTVACHELVPRSTDSGGATAQPPLLAAPLHL